MSHRTTPPTIVLTDAPEADEVASISAALYGFTIEASGVDDHRPLAVLVRDPDSGQVIGGLTGRTSLGVLLVDLFHLPDELRGLGVGSEILRQAEEDGRKRGCRRAVLYTISFQAPEFYRGTAGAPSARSPATRRARAASS